MALYGLDCPSGYWSKALKDELGVTSAIAIQFIGPESYFSLEKYAKSASQKKALRKLLNLETGSYKEQRCKEKEMLMNRHKQIEQWLQSLKSVSSDGKQRDDISVQIVESRLCEMYQIPQTVWVPKDVGIECMIELLEGSQLRIAALEKSAELSATDLLQKVSNGLAVQGILLSNEHHEQLSVRDSLLKVPEVVQPLKVAHPQSAQFKQFSTKLEESEFIKATRLLGYSVSSTNLGFWSVSTEARMGVSVANEEKLAYNEATIEYFSTFKCIVMPMTSFSFSDNDLLLSDEALKHLLIIEDVMIKYGPNSSNFQSSSEKFFQKFGSHVNQGPIHFGGIYILKCSTVGFDESELLSVKQLQRDAVQNFMNIASVKSAYKGKCSDTTISQTNLNVITIGGPSEEVSFHEWKMCIAANNTTWSLIDRGTCLKSVWDIIDVNTRCKYFHNASEFCKSLKKAWHIMIDPRESSTISDLQSIYGIHAVLQTVNSWNEHVEHSHHTKLLALCDVKTAVLKCSLDPLAWSSLYLSQTPIQKYLQSVVFDSEQGHTSDEMDLKDIMKEIVERTDLNAMSCLDFPPKSSISLWIYGQQSVFVPMTSEDCVKLYKYFQLVTQDTLAATDDLHDVDATTIMTSHSNEHTNKVTVAVSKAINCLYRNVHNCGQKYYELFIATIVYPFHHSMEYYPIVLKPLSAHSVEFLHKKLKKECANFFKIQQIGMESLQAYLYHLAINMYFDTHEIDVREEQFQSHLSHMNNVIGDELQPSIKDLLSTMPQDLHKIQLELYRLAITNTHIELGGCSHSLKDVLENLCKSNEDLALTPDKHLQQEANSEVDNGDTELKKNSSKYQKEGDLNVPKESQDALELMKALELVKHYPQKLTLHDALCIREEMLESSKCTRPCQLPFFTLQHIMTYDLRCRADLMEEYVHQTSVLEIDDFFVEYSHDEDNNDSEDLFEDALEYHSIHPMDSLLALIHCADDFLRQDIFARMTTIQLAIPLVLPDPFTKKLTLPLWAMRSIVKEWKSRSHNDVVEHECPIIGYKTPIISFVRFGKSTKSKSKMLNDVISDSHYDHFFHRDCQGGTYRTLLSNGLVELCWYLPAGKEDDNFS